ncbi:hypothetical protein G6F65_018079 [Rhizopus arrhizus]|nr:hypothetical protein G6F65_018079 [Rhizopus arrhizus]
MPMPPSAWPVAIASSSWSVDPLKLMRSTFNPYFSKKPRSSATDTGDWQTAVWLHAILNVRGAESAASTRAPSMPSGAANPATLAARNRARRETPRAVSAGAWTFVFINLPFEQTVNGDDCHAASSACCQGFDKYKVGITIWGPTPAITVADPTSPALARYSGRGSGTPSSSTFLTRSNALRAADIASIVLRMRRLT